MANYSFKELNHLVEVKAEKDNRNEFCLYTFNPSDVSRIDYTVSLSQADEEQHATLTVFFRRNSDNLWFNSEQLQLLHDLYTHIKGRMLPPEIEKDYFE